MGWNRSRLSPPHWQPGATPHSGAEGSLGSLASMDHTALRCAHRGENLMSHPVSPQGWGLSSCPQALGSHHPCLHPQVQWPEPGAQV